LFELARITYIYWPIECTKPKTLNLQIRFI
jgi:hypothetical protein